MKKSCILVLFAMLTLSLSAQHVTPLNIHLTEVNLEELRSQYSGQSYLIELQRLDRLMKDDTKALKDAQAQLKAEQNYHKQMSAYVDKTDAAFKSLQTMAVKEMDELKKMKENVDKQLRDINSNNQLNEETRSKIVEQLQQQRRGLEAAINANNSRQAQLANHPVQLQQMRTDLMVFNSEIIHKDTDLKQLETLLKQRRDIIKAETKNVKAQKK